MPSNPSSERGRDWVTVRMPDMESAGALCDAFGSGWGERGVAVELPDYFDFHIASQPPGKTLRAALEIIQEWLRTNTRATVVVESEGTHYTLGSTGDLPATDVSDSVEPVVPTGKHLIATFKCEDLLDDGQAVGPVWVWDAVAKKLVWRSEEWMRESDFVLLSEKHDWLPEFDR